MERLRSLFSEFDKSRILVVGDVYLDETTLGRLAGVSNEAPVPVFEESERKYNPGAAGNVACNFAAMGATVTIVGVIGADHNSDILREAFRRANVETKGLVIDTERPTNVYGKIRAGVADAGDAQEILRSDTSSPGFIPEDIEAQVVINISELAADVDAIVVIDQAQSVVTEPVLQEVLACAGQRGLLTVGDSHTRIGEFKGFGLAVPNGRELGIGVDMDTSTPEGLEDAGRVLLLNCERALITGGPRGIIGFDESETFQQASVATDVVDVTGAGDSVTAASTLTLLAGGELAEAAEIANAAAAVSVSKTGAIAVTRSAIVSRLSRRGLPAAAVPMEELQAIVKSLREEGRCVVWTNGCFDILHAGHVLYLSKAKREGDVLIVGLNSDASVAAVKGPDRPVVPEDERALIISALQYVDYVTVFSGEDVTPILEALQPDVYAKGGDYTIETINQDERAVVEGYGGRIALVPGVEGRSTTNIVSKLADEYQE